MAANPKGMHSRKSNSLVIGAMVLVVSATLFSTVFTTRCRHFEKNDPYPQNAALVDEFKAYAVTSYLAGICGCILASTSVTSLLCRKKRSSGSFIYDVPNRRFYQSYTVGKSRWLDDASRPRRPANEDRDSSRKAAPIPHGSTTHGYNAGARIGGLRGASSGSHGSLTHAGCAPQLFDL